jgi:hypothetical protein
MFAETTIVLLLNYMPHQALLLDDNEDTLVVTFEGSTGDVQHSERVAEFEYGSRKETLSRTLR